MKVVWEDTSYYKEKPDVRRSVDMAVAKLKSRLTEYVDNQNISVRKIFGDDVMMHEIINKYFYVYKCKVNQMQIRILYTMRDDKLVIISHWYKNRTNNDYIKYFKDITSSMRCECVC